MLQNAAAAFYQTRVATQQPMPSSDELTQFVTGKVNELYQIGKMRRDAEKARLGITEAPEGQGNADLERDVRAAQVLSQYGPLGMSTYRHLATTLAGEAPPSNIIRDALVLWRSRHEPSPALLELHRRYQQEYGPTPYEYFLSALAVYAAPSSATPASSSAPTK